MWVPYIYAPIHFTFNIEDLIGVIRLVKAASKKYKEKEGIRVRRIIWKSSVIEKLYLKSDKKIQYEIVTKRKLTRES